MTTPLANLDVSQAHDKVVIRITGEIDLSNAAAIQSAIEEAIVGAAQVVIDLSDISYIDSQGMRLLLRVERHTSANSIQLTVVAPTDSVVAEVLRITQIEDLMKVVESFD